MLSLLASSPGGYRGLGGCVCTSWIRALGAQPSLSLCVRCRASGTSMPSRFWKPCFSSSAPLRPAGVRWSFAHAHNPRHTTHTARTERASGVCMLAGVVKRAVSFYLKAIEVEAAVAAACGGRGRGSLARRRLARLSSPSTFSNRPFAPGSSMRPGCCRSASLLLTGLSACYSCECARLFCL